MSILKVLNQALESGQELLVESLIVLCLLNVDLNKLQDISSCLLHLLDSLVVLQVEVVADVLSVDPVNVDQVHKDLLEVRSISLARCFSNFLVYFQKVVYFSNDFRKTKCIRVFVGLDHQVHPLSANVLGKFENHVVSNLRVGFSTNHVAHSEVDHDFMVVAEILHGVGDLIDQLKDVRPAFVLLNAYEHVLGEF